MSEQKKLNASERISNLETALMQLYQTANNMASDLLTAKEAVKLLGKKLAAVQQAAGISDDQANQIMVAENVAELTEKTQKLVADGILVEAEEITENCFVVGKEIDTDGKLVNPRLQFAVNAIQGETKEKLIGSLKGDTVSFGENKYSFEVCEVYSIVNPTAAAPAEASDEAAAQ